MRIGELARRCGTSVRTLRYYESRGLLHPRRDASGYRRYLPGHVDQVAEIRRMLAAGFTTEEIREFLPCFTGEEPAGPCEQGLRRHLEKLRELDRLLAELGGRRARLLERLQRFGIAPQEIPSHERSNADDVTSHPSAGAGRHRLYHRRR